MLRRVGLGCLAAASALIAAAPFAAACQMALVLAQDVSSSVSEREFELQAQGHAAAFRTPDIQREILAMGEIRVTLMHWAGAGYQESLIPWRRLSTVTEINAFAAELAAAPRHVTVGSTAIGDMLAAVEKVWDAEAENCARWAIDISGDGSQNSGRPTGPPRERLLARGVTINALVIVTDEIKRPPPLPHYREKVIGGPGAFAVEARGFDDFGRAFLGKLGRELRGPTVARRKDRSPAPAGGG